MMPIENRRELSSNRLTPLPSLSPSLRPDMVRSAIGITMWFETMIESAMASTMIIEVADENPPMKANSASPCCPAASGRVRTNMSGFDPAGIEVSPKSAIGSVKRLISSK